MSNSDSTEAAQVLLERANDANRMVGKIFVLSDHLRNDCENVEHLLFDISEEVRKMQLNDDLDIDTQNTLESIRHSLDITKNHVYEGYKNIENAMQSNNRASNIVHQTVDKIHEINKVGN